MTESWAGPGNKAIVYCALLYLAYSIQTTSDEPGNKAIVYCALLYLACSIQTTSDEPGNKAIVYCALTSLGTRLREDGMFNLYLGLYRV